MSPPPRSSDEEDGNEKNEPVSKDDMEHSEIVVAPGHPRRS